MVRLVSNQKERKLKVVIAEDSVLIRDLLAEVLGRIEGIDILGMAPNGAEATTMIQELRPDVVILDISMPIKSGIEVLKEIRPSNQSLVIIMFTADASDVMREACLEWGADHYLSKSHLRDLLDICRQYLHVNPMKPSLEANNIQ